MGTTNLKSFHYLENGDISYSILDTVKSTKILDSGVYKLSVNAYDDKLIINMDKNDESVRIHNFSDKNKLDELFNSFFDEAMGSKIRGMGFYHKTGIILHGKEVCRRKKYYYSVAR